MSKPTKYVDQCVRDLWAIMASRAAFKAVDKVTFNEDAAAEAWAKITERWLTRAGTHAASRRFTLPRL